MPAVRAVIIGLVLSAAGTFPWVFLSGWNLRVFVSWPWAMLPMAMYLYLYWRYLNGAGWPQKTAELRRMSLRANRLSGEIWGMSIFAGLLGLSALLPLLSIMSRLVRMPVEEQPIATPPEMPFVTLFLLLV